MRRLLAMPVLMVAFLAAGCGIFEPVSCDTEIGSAPSQAGVPTKADGYSFRLPEGDRSPNKLIESSAYEELARGRCDAAAQMLQRKESTADALGWSDFQDPREVLLYTAGLRLCQKNVNDARRLYNEVKTQYGDWVGIGWDAQTTAILHWHVCEMYRNVASVIEQRSEKDFKCARYGDTPSYLYDWDAAGKPDPRP